MRERHVIFVGPPKSGTTFLYSVMEEVGVGLSTRKEIMFYDFNFFRGINWYRRHSVNDLLIDCSPTYIGSDAFFENINKNDLGVRRDFVYVVRDPRDRLRSGLNDLAEWVRKPIALDSLHDGVYVDRFGGHRVYPIQESKHRENILRLIDICEPGDHLYLIRFEDLVNSPIDFINFLDLNLNVDISVDNIKAIRRHSSWSFRSKAVARILNLSFFRLFVLYLPRCLQVWCKKIYLTLLQLNSTRSKSLFADDDIASIVEEERLFKNEWKNLPLSEFEARAASRAVSLFIYNSAKQVCEL